MGVKKTITDEGKTEINFSASWGVFIVILWGLLLVTLVVLHHIGVI